MPTTVNLYTSRQLAAPLVYENILWKFSVLRHSKLDQYGLFAEFTPIEKDEAVEYDAVLKAFTPGNEWQNRRQKFRMCGNLELIATKKISEYQNCKIDIDVKKHTLFGFSEQFNTPIPNITDATLHVGPESFDVCKKILAQKSTWFYNLFYADGALPNKVNYYLSNTESRNFRLFLHLLCNPKSAIPLDKFTVLAKMADKFGAEQCFRECEKFLITNNNIRSKEKLEMAFSRGYKVLHDFVLKQMKTKEDVVNLSGNFESYTQAQKMNRIDEIIQRKDPSGVKYIRIEDQVEHEIGGIPFKISCSENVVTIDCNWQDTSNPWKCEVSFDDPNKTFCFDYLNPTMKFNKTTPNIRIVVNYFVGTFPRNIINFKMPRENLTDIVLMAKYEKFFVSKQILANASVYFEKMFYSDKAEEQKIVLDDVDPKEFNELLEHIYFPEKNVTEKKIEGLLNSSRKFEVAQIDQKCEQILLNESAINEVLKIKLVEMYYPDLLKKYISRRFKSFKDLEALSKIQGFEKLRKEIIGEISFSICNSVDTTNPDAGNRN